MSPSRDNKQNDTTLRDQASKAIQKRHQQAWQLLLCTSDRLYKIFSKLEIMKKTIQDGEEILETNDISDWYHTFGELYKHRIHLYISLCKSKVEWENQRKEISELSETVYHKFFTVSKSKLHDDGSTFEWWFILQMETPYWQISYHLPNDYWNAILDVKVLEKANKWDWHTSDDVLERLLRL